MYKVSKKPPRIDKVELMAETPKFIHFEYENGTNDYLPKSQIGITLFHEWEEARTFLFHYVNERLAESSRGTWELSLILKRIFTMEKP